MFNNQKKNKVGKSFVQLYPIVTRQKTPPKPKAGFILQQDLFFYNLFHETNIRGSKKSRNAKPKENEKNQVQDDDNRYAKIPFLNLKEIFEGRKLDSASCYRIKKINTGKGNNDTIYPKSKKLQTRKLEFPLPKTPLPSNSSIVYYPQFEKHNDIVYIADDLNIESKLSKKFFFKLKKQNKFTESKIVPLIRLDKTPKEDKNDKFNEDKAFDVICSNFQNFHLQFRRPKSCVKVGGQYNLLKHKTRKVTDTMFKTQIKQEF